MKLSQFCQAAFGELGTLHFPAGLPPGRVPPDSVRLSDTKTSAVSVNPTVVYWMPWRVNQPLVTVKKEIHLKQPRSNAAALAAYQLFNFALYENRDTHELELILTTYGQELGQKNWMNADCWRYYLSLAPTTVGVTRKGN